MTREQVLELVGKTGVFLRRDRGKWVVFLSLLDTVDGELEIATVSADFVERYPEIAKAFMELTAQAMECVPKGVAGPQATVESTEPEPGAAAGADALSGFEDEPRKPEDDDLAELIDAIIVGARFVSAGYSALARCANPPAPEDEFYPMRVIFFAGANHLWSTASDCIIPDGKGGGWVRPNVMRAFHQIREELREFGERLDEHNDTLESKE